MGWHACLRLDYRRDAERTVGTHAHEGPLRVLKALYPEGPAVCHHVLVHPPAGLVGGDTLEMHAALGPGTHVLLTTPGATRFYRSQGQAACQQLHFALGHGARLEWLPGETLIYNAAQAVNRQRFELAEGAQMLGWDILALGLPAAGAPFVAGSVLQHLEVAGSWLERARIDASDPQLLDSPLGLAGRRALATLWWAAGAAGEAAALERALEAARALCAAAPEGVWAAATLMHPRLLVLRALGDRVEPLVQLLRPARAAWREILWGLGAEPPRLWAT